LASLPEVDPWLLLLLLPLVPWSPLLLPLPPPVAVEELLDLVEVADDEVSVSPLLPPTALPAASVLLASDADAVAVSLSVVGEDVDVDSESSANPVAVELLSTAVDSNPVPVPVPASPGELVVELFGS
jgi:hypothetical protein